MIYITEFLVYLVVLLLIGLYSMKKQTLGNEGFIIGGRTLGPLTTAVSAGASDMSSWLLLGLPGAVFASGLVEGIWISLGLRSARISTGSSWQSGCVHEREVFAITLPSFISKRFDDPKGILRLIANLVILFSLRSMSPPASRAARFFLHTRLARQKSSPAGYRSGCYILYVPGGYLAVCLTDLCRTAHAHALFCAVLGYVAISEPVLTFCNPPNAFSIPPAG